MCEGLAALKLVHLSSDQAVWVQTLVRDIVLRSLGRHSTLTVPLFTQVYKWVRASLMLARGSR